MKHYAAGAITRPVYMHHLESPLSRSRVPVQRSTSFLVHSLIQDLRPRLILICKSDQCALCLTLASHRIFNKSLTYR
jgi:hypothetical protein